MAFSFKIPDSLKRSPEKVAESPLRGSPKLSSIASGSSMEARKKPNYGMFGRATQQEANEQDASQKRLQLAKRTSPSDIAKRFATRSFAKKATAKAAESIKRRTSSSTSGGHSVVSPTSKRMLTFGSVKKKATTSKGAFKSSDRQSEMRAPAEFFPSKAMKADIAAEKEPEKAVPQMSRSEIASKLRLLVGKRCHTVYEQYQLLDERDKLLCKGRVKTTDVDAAIESMGACCDMCPEKERYLREVQKRISAYECDDNGRVLPQLTVKDYSRSAADQEEPLPHELRSGPVLMMTMDYLMAEIATETPANESDLPTWYDFMWTRTRAIRKDITQQMMIDEIAVALIEKCARLHIFASHRLCEFDYNEFDQKMNTENLTKCLLSLRHLYEDLAKKDISCPNEAEFRAYDVMLNLNDSNILRQVLTYPESIRQSPEVRLAVLLFTAVQNNNYVKFFRLIKERASYLQACLCHRYFYQVRSNAIKTITRSYTLNGQYAVSDLTRLLSFESDEMSVSFAAIFGVKCDREDPTSFLLNRQRFMVPEHEAPITKHEWIESIRDRSLSEILNGGSVLTPELPDPIVSFDSNGNYLYDPVLAPYLGLGSASEELYGGLPPPALPPPPKAKELTLEDIKAIESMNSSVIREVTEPIVRLVARETFLLGVAENQLQSMTDSFTRRIVELTYEKERQENLQRKEEEKQQRQRQLVEQVAQNLLDSLLQQHVQANVSVAASQELSAARLTKKRGEISQLAVEWRDALLWATVSESVVTVCAKVFDTDVIGRRSALQAIRSRLDRLWLRQFADRWLLVGAKRRKRRLTLQQFPIGPIGDLIKSAEAMGMGRKRRRLSCPGNISIQLDRYLNYASTRNVREFVEKRHNKLASKYAAKWIAFVRRRQQRRELFESFSAGPSFDSVAEIIPTKRSRVNFPNHLNAVWKHTQQALNWSTSDASLNSSNVDERSKRHIDLAE
uniref:PCI domain-containing protein n=1 Tax=Plectus sambesii TaxID=2011161 RepID=A0A914WFJ6_9BILA